MVTRRHSLAVVGGAGEEPSIPLFVSVRFRFSYLRTVSVPEATSRGEWVGIEPGRRFGIARRAFRAPVEPQSARRNRPPCARPAAHWPCCTDGRGVRSHGRALVYYGRVAHHHCEPGPRP